MSDIDPAARVDASGAARDVDAKAVAAVSAALADRDGRLAAYLLAARHPADAADLLEQLAGDHFRALLDLAPTAFTPEILSELADPLRAEAVEALPVTAVADAVSDLESDDAALILEDADPERLSEILEAVPDRDRADLEETLAFEEDTAGRLMQREFAAAPEFWTVGDVIDHMRAAGPDQLPEAFFEIYVVDPGFRPVGAVPLARLMRGVRETALTRIMEPVSLRVSPDMDQEDAAYAFRKYHLVQAPVVDAAGRLKGMLTVDDMVEVVNEETTEDLLALAGVSEAGPSDSVVRTVRTRAPWLFVNLGTAVLASLAIALFDDAIAQLVALAVLMPIVASMGGNAGTQTLAVAVRALAERDLTSANARRIVWREVLAGGANGLVFAVVMGLACFLWYRDVGLALVIAAAMVATLVCAGLAGILIPLALKRAGADPAVSSAVFVTTATDLIGFVSFLGLAALVLL